MAELHDLDGGGEVFPIGDVTTIGRGAECDVRLEGERVSRNHAVVRRLADGSVEIEDLGSTHGTVVDGRPILAPTRLHSHSEIRIGARRLRFVEGDAPPMPETRTFVRAAPPRPPSDLVRLGEPESNIRHRVESSPDLDLTEPETVADADLRAAYERLRAVVGLSRAITAERSVDRLLTRLLEFLCAEVGAEYGAALLADPASGAPVARATFGPDGPGANVLVSNTIVRDVLATAASVLSADVGSEKRYEEAGSIRAGGLRSVMCVPMRHAGQTVGVVHLHTTGRGDAFTRAHLGLGTLLAGQAAMAVRSALAAEEVERVQSGERQRLRALVRDLPVALVVLDSGQRVRLANHQAMQLLGADACVEDERLEAVGEHPLASLLSVRDGDVQELTLAGPPRRVLLVSTATVRTSPDRDEEALLVLRDVTAVREREAKAQIRERLALVGQLVGGVAHDFNNLLAVMMGYAALAVRELPGDHPVGAYVAEVHSAAERAAALVRQLLRVGRPDRSRPEVVNVDAVIESLRSLFRRTLGEHIALEYALSAATWQVEMDPSRLEQLLLNLVVNARDAIDSQGSIKVTSRVVLDGEADVPGPGAWVCLTVADTGVGMAPEVVGQVFEPFFTTKSPGRGTGLGLATVADVVREAGGTVSVTSTPGRGTTFRVHLPATRRPSTYTVPQPIEEPPRGRGELILVVEDEGALRRLMRDTLERAGYRVVEARNGIEALATLQSEAGVAAVLTDVVMPGMSGPQLAQDLAGRGDRRPIIFMTGYSDAASLGPLPNAERYPVLRKPVPEASLAVALHSALH